MKRLTLAVLLCLTLCPVYSLSRAQDEPLWKYIATTTNEKTGESISFHARDCYRYTDKESEKYPKLAVKTSRIGTNIKETVSEYDCKRRASRIRIWIYTDNTEKKEADLEWTEVVPGSPGEALLNYACRDRSKEKK